jgi:ketosteroid isomerase-like protein
MRTKAFIRGVIVAIAGRAILIQLLRLKFARDVSRLNGGDYSGLLSAYGDDVVLHFNEGDHRWSGDWVGKAGLERFLQNFAAARLQGEIREMILWARFDDHADAPDGTRIYDNRTVLVLRTRWGKIVEQNDFYADTAPILSLDRKLTDLGIEPIPRP